MDIVHTRILLADCVRQVILSFEAVTHGREIDRRVLTAGFWVHNL